VQLDPILLAKAAVMGVVEGLTEFLPISSTGHLILAGSLLDFAGEKGKVFDIAIQSGAMFAVIWQFRERIARTIAGLTRDAGAQRFAANVMIAFAPAVVFGLVLGKGIKARLFHAVPVALAFIVGALIILWVERRQRDAGTPPRIDSVDAMRPRDALAVGVLQCLALIPGTSRSGATIIGAMVLGLSRKAATEFSFYLGIPTLIGAGAYSLWKERAALSLADAPLFVVGLAFAFASALLCIRWLIRYVSTHDFVPFAWYRIVFGGLVLLTAWTGRVAWGD
jgi:undecaprenyl-diphosphatase